MQKFSSSPLKPDLPGLTWRTLTNADLPAVVELARACQAADGGLTFMAEPEYIQEAYFPAEASVGIGAFTGDGRLAACAAVHGAVSSGRRQASLLGQVAPDWRGQGIGAYLMGWSEAQARAGAASAGASSVEMETPGSFVLQIGTESLAEPARRLYRANGFIQVMEEVVMQQDLRLPLPDFPLPPGVSLYPWQLSLADQFFQAYQNAFRERPGFPGWSAAEWIGHVVDNDHKPEWSFLARVDGKPAGFVIGTVDLTSTPPGGYIWQVGVVPGQRRRGLASALLVETMRKMQAEGALSAQLAVHINNPGAIQAYARLGMQVSGRRARYERTIENP